MCAGIQVRGGAGRIRGAGRGICGRPAIGRGLRVAGFAAQGLPTVGSRSPSGRLREPRSDGIAALNFLSAIGFEDVAPDAYQKGSDVPTIGIGHTGDVSLGDTMTSDQIVDAFMNDVSIAEGAVENLVGDLQVSQQEFDALVDLAFNVGETKLNSTNSPNLNQAIADGNYSAIGANLRYARGPDGPTAGLVARSNSRQAIFSKGDYSQGVNRYDALLRFLRAN